MSSRMVRGLFAPSSFLTRWKPRMLRDGLFERAVDPDALVGRLVVAVEGEGQLVEPGFDEAPGLVLVEQGGVRVELGHDPGRVGVADHLEEIRVEQGFAAVDEVGLVDEAGGLVDDLPEEVERHVPLVPPVQVLVGAHDALEVAEARRLDPEPDGEVGEDRLLFL